MVYITTQSKIVANGIVIIGILALPINIATKGIAASVTNQRRKSSSDPNFNILRMAKITLSILFIANVRFFLKNEYKFFSTSNSLSIFLVVVSRN